MMLTFVLPKRLEDLGAPLDTVGRIMSMWGWAPMLLIPVIGHFMDRYGRKPFALTGALLMAISSIGFALASTPDWPVYACRAVQGLGFVMGYTAITAAQADLSPGSVLPRVYLVTGIWALLMHVIGPVAGELIYRQFGYAPVAWLALAASLVAAGMILVLPESRKANPAGTTPAVPGGIIRFMRERGILPVLFFNLVEVAAYTATVTFIMTFARAQGLPSTRLFFFAYPLMGIALRLLFSRAPGRFGTQRVIYATMIFYVAGIGSLAWLQTPAHLFIAGLAVGAGITFVNPLLSALAIERAGDPAYTGRISGWFVFAWCLGGTLAPLLFGIVAGHAGYPAMFLAVAAMLLAGNLLFAWSDWRLARTVSAPLFPPMRGTPLR